MLSNKGNYAMHIVVVFVVLFSAFVWAPYAILSSDMNIFMRISCLIVGVLSVLALFNRDLYLPFLADAAIPDSLIPVTVQPKDIQNHTSKTIVVIKNLPPLTKVIYWAADSEDPRLQGSNVSWKQAYGDYSNSGVVMSDAQGVATIHIHCPQSYTVKRFLFNQTLKPHIHYRYVLGKSMLSKVYTRQVKC